MSLAVFTDSTTAHASPAFTCRPTAGSSTKTISVNSCCAWSVMPTTAVSPVTRTHSWVLSYLRSEGTWIINGSNFSHREAQSAQKGNQFCAPAWKSQVDSRRSGTVAADVRRLRLKSEFRIPNSEIEMSLLTSAATDS